MYAVIETGGKQYRVSRATSSTSSGRRRDEASEAIVFDRVLLVGERRRASRSAIR